MRIIDPVPRWFSRATVGVGVTIHTGLPYIMICPAIVLLVTGKAAPAVQKLKALLSLGAQAVGKTDR